MKGGVCRRGAGSKAKRREKTRKTRRDTPSRNTYAEESKGEDALGRGFANGLPSALEGESEEKNKKGLGRGNHEQHLL